MRGHWPARPCLAVALTDSIPGMAASAGSGGMVLVLNSGSSSVKFALLDPETGQRALGGIAEKVGSPEAVLRIGQEPGEALPDGSYASVIARILSHLADAGHASIVGAGHRVVHGGERFSDSVLVD